MQENILKSYYADFSQDLSVDGKNSPENRINTAFDENLKSENDPANTLNAGSVTADGTDTAGETLETVQISKIKVYICGFVNSPGVYELDAGARVADLVDLSGGAKENAALEAVNLAAVLEDSDMVYIPSYEEIEEKGLPYLTGGIIKSGEEAFIISGTNKASEGQAGQLQSINLNRASAGELATLPGIGEVIASNIIEYREKYGGFKNKEELKNVKGIGEKKYEKIKDLISV